MAEYSVSELKKDVRIVLGENENIDQLLEDNGVNDDQLELERDTLMDSMILRAIDKVHHLAPLAIVSDVAVDDNLVFRDGDYCSVANLTDDFLRFVSARADNWMRAVFNPIDQDSEQYEWLNSEFASVRATKRFPAVAIVPDYINGGMRIEAYPKLEEEDTILVRTIHMASLNEDENTGELKVNIAKRCYTAVVYTIASLYYVSINEHEKSQRMAAEAAEAMELTVK